MARWWAPGADAMREQMAAHPVSALVLGILLMVLGTAAIFLPQASTLAVNVIIGWLLLLSGAVYGWSVLSMHGGWQIAGVVFLALLCMVIGILLLMYPVRGAITLTLLMSVFFLVSGIVKLHGAIRSSHVRGRWWGAIGGIVSMTIAGFVFAGWPETGTWALGLLVGGDLIFSGVALVAGYPTVHGDAPVG